MKTRKTKTKDLTPKAATTVKGGGRYPNDNTTLVRGAKPTGGKKDLAPKSPAKVKGGGRYFNDNITLVRVSSR